jgi:hypothetical protein
MGVNVEDDLLGGVPSVLSATSLRLGAPDGLAPFVVIAQTTATAAMIASKMAPIQVTRLRRRMRCACSACIRAILARAASRFLLALATRTAPR